MQALQLEQNRLGHMAFDLNCSIGTSRTLIWLVALKLLEEQVSMLSLLDLLAHT